MLHKHIVLNHQLYRGVNHFEKKCTRFLGFLGFLRFFWDLWDFFGIY